MDWQNIFDTIGAVRDNTPTEPEGGRNPFDYGYGQGVNPQTPVYGLLQAMQAHRREVERANQMAMQPQEMPRQRNQTLLELLGTALLAGADRTGGLANSFQQGLQRGIQGRYEGDVNAYNADMQRRQMEAQNRIQNSQFGVDQAKLVADYQQNQMNQKAAREQAIRQSIAAQQAKREQYAQQLKLKELENQGKIDARSLGILMSMPAAARPGFAKDKLGFTDQDVLNALSVETPAERKAAADAALAGAKAKTEATLLPQRLIDLTNSGKLKEAQAEAAKTMSAYRQMMTEWMPKNYASEINKRQADAAAAMKRIEQAAAFHAMGKPANVSKDAEKLRFDIEKYDAEADVLNSNLRQMEQDTELFTPAQVMAARTALQQNRALRALSQKRYEQALSMTPTGPAPISGSDFQGVNVDQIGAGDPSSVREMTSRVAQDAAKELAGKPAKSAPRKSKVYVSPTGGKFTFSGG